MSHEYIKRIGSLINKVGVFLFVLTIIICFPSLQSKAQTTTGGVSIKQGNHEPDPSAVLDVVSGKKGVLFPRMSTYARTHIDSPKPGLIVYDTDHKEFYYRDIDNCWRALVNYKDYPTPATTSPYNESPGMAPLGTVIMFFGDLSGKFDATSGHGVAGTQYEGWALCINEYTYNSVQVPDLRGKFVACQALQGSTGDFADQGDIGGNLNITLTDNQLLHNHVVSNQPIPMTVSPHKHKLPDLEHFHYIHRNSGGSGDAVDNGGTDGSNEYLPTENDIFGGSGQSNWGTPSNHHTQPEWTVDDPSLGPLTGTTQLPPGIFAAVGGGGRTPVEIKPPTYVLAYIIRIK